MLTDKEDLYGLFNEILEHCDQDQEAGYLLQLKVL